MSTFEGVLLGLAFVGLGIPAWLFSIAVYHAAKKPRTTDPSSRYFAYTRLMDRILDELEKDKGRGPVMVASIRELGFYPEYRDITVLLLNEVTVTGQNQYDRLMKVELQETEAFLLDAKDE